MSPASTHPQKDQLVAFGLGKLEPAEASVVEQHLETCPDCSSTILNLQDDTFVALVRSCPEPVPSPSWSEATLELTSGLSAGSGSHLPPPGCDASPAGSLPSELRSHGRYEILDLIGRGGMGDVYRAQHKLMNRAVALKVIKPQLVRNEAAVQRFRREVQAAARLHHRNIVTAYDAEQAADQHFLVMEFVDGTTLDQIVRDRGPLPLSEACNFIRQAAEGLQHAHELGMVHRDVKPHNLMVTKAGEVKILDFGLAGFATEVAEEEIRAENTQSNLETAAALHQLTQMGTMMGTPDYISPEQAANAHSADIRADIYSLGCTFYTLLAGAAPFNAGTVLDKIKAHAEQAPRALHELRSDVSPEVEAVVQRMMAKDPLDRYQTPQDVVDALTKLIDARIDDRLRRHGIGEPPMPPKPRTVGDSDGRFNNIAKLVGLTLLVVAIVAGVIAGTWQAIYLATDTGRLEIKDNPEIPGAQIVLVKDGRDYAAFDVEPGVKMQRIRAGQYEVLLRGAPQGFDLNVWTTKDGKPHDFGGPYDPRGKLITVYRGGGLSIEIQGQSRGTQVAGSGSAWPRGSTPVIADSPDNLKLLAEFAGHTNVVRAVRFLPGNERLVSVDGNGNVIVWDAKTRRIARRFKIPGETYSDADISTDGKLLAVGSDWGTTKGRMEIWDIEKGAALHRLTHRFNNIEQMRFSPDGGKLVAVGSPPVAVVWDVAAGKELQTFNSGLANDDQLKSGAFTPDGSAVVFGSVGRVHAFSLEPSPVGSKLDLSSRHSVPDLAFSPNGNQLAAIHGGGPIALIDTKSWSVTKMLPNATSSQLFRSGAFVDNHLLVTGSDQGFLHLQKLDGTVVATAQGGAGSCLHVNVSSDSRQVVTAGGWLYDNRTQQWTVTSDFKLRLWELPESVLSTEEAGGPPKLIEDMRLEGHEDFVLALDYTPDGSRVISGGAADHVLVSNARSSRRAGELVGHTRTVHALDVSSDGKSVTAAGKSGEILVWELATEKIIQRLKGHTGWIECVAFSPDGQRIASGSSNWTPNERDLTIRMWDVASGRQLWQTAAPPVLKGQGQVFEVLFTPDGQHLVTVHHAPHDGVSVWDAETGALERRFSGSHSSIKCADLSPDGRTLATGHEAVDLRELAWDDPENAVIRLWDFETGREIGQLAGHTGGIQSVKFSSDGGQLVSCSGGQFLHDAFRPQPSRDNTVRVWDVASRRELFRQPLEKHGQAAVFSPDGRFIASSAGVFNEKPLVQIWRLPERVERQPPLTIGMNDEFGMLFEGRLVAPAELGRRLDEALKENPDREVAIDLPQRPWTVVPHVDQLEQIARVAGAKRITRPAWAESAVPAAVPTDLHESMPASTFFQSLGDLQDIVRTRVEQYGGKMDGKPTSGPNRLQYVARVGGVDVKLIDLLYADLKSKAEAANATVSQEEERDVQLRVFRYLTPSRRGEVAVTLTEIPLEAGKNWRLEIEVFEWPKGTLTPNEVFVHYLRNGGGTTIRLDGETVSREDLLKRLSEMARRNSGLQVLFDGDLVPIGADVRELMQAVTTTGIPERNVKFAPSATRRFLGEATPLMIGMNDEFGMLFEGRLVAPAELSRLLKEALKENPDREVAIDLPKMAWTIAGHVDQLEQIARITGARWITRPAWSQIRIVFGVEKSGQQTLDIQGPGYSATGFLKDHLLNVREVIAKNPRLPVQIEVAEHIRFSDPGIAEGIEEVRRVAEEAGAKVRVLRTRRDNVNASKPLDQIQQLHRLQSHTGSIERLAFIDNTRFVSAGLMGEEFVWDARQGKRVQTLTEPNRLLTAVAAAPAAGLFATGNSYGQIRLWNKDLTTTGTMKGPEAILERLAMSADGSLLMSSGSGDDLMPRIWNTKTQELVRMLDSKSGLIVAAAFTPDGKRLITGGIAKHLGVWNVATGELLSTIELGMEVRTLSLSPDGRLAAVASSDPVVIVDLQTKEVTHRLNGHTLRVQTVAFLPDGRHVVSGSQDKTWRVWSLAESREVAQVTGTTPHTHTLAVSPDGKLVAGGGGEPYDQTAKSFPKDGDYDLRVWELPESLWPIAGATADRIVVEISVDGQFRLAGRALSVLELSNRLKGMLEENPEREVHVIPAERFRGAPFQALLAVVRNAGAKNVTWPEEGLAEAIILLSELPGSKEWITDVAYPENYRAITVAVDGVVRVWKNGGRGRAELESHQLPFGGQAAISPDGRLVVVASAANDKDVASVALWELDGWKERWKIEVPTTTTKLTPQFLVDVRFAPNDRVIVRSNVDSGVAIVDAANGKVLSRYPEKGPATGVASISPDGQRLFVRQMAPAPLGRIYRLEDGAELAQIDTRDVVLDAVWSRDGAQLILAESTLNEGRIAVFDASTGELVRRWVAEPKGIESLALGQGNLLVTGGLTRIAVWDWSTEKLLAAVDSPQQDGDARLAIAISPDGKRLISGGARWLDGEDRLPRLWQLPQSVWPK